jgi:hypothetical protein
MVFEISKNVILCNSVYCILNVKIVHNVNKRFWCYIYILTNVPLIQWRLTVDQTGQTELDS